MFKIFFYVLVFFAGTGFAQFSSKVIVNPMSYDFGDIKQGMIVSKIFNITNDGNDVLVIKKVRASCGCTAAKTTLNELKPGESTELKVDFNSEGRAGKQNKNVYIDTNDPDNSSIKISFTGNVVTAEKFAELSKNPKIGFKETTHDFGKVKEGEVVDHTFKFTNNGKSILEIKDIKTSCGCTAALVSSKKIEPGKEGTLRVELDTSNRSGKMTRNITIASNDPEEPTKLLTISAEVIKEAQ